MSPEREIENLIYRYAELLDLGDKGWHFAARQMLPRLYGELGEHLGAPL